MTAYRKMFLAGTIAVTTLAGAAQAQDIKSPLHGLISMGAYKFVGAGGDPVTRSSRSTPSPESSAAWW